MSDKEDKSRSFPSEALDILKSLNPFSFSEKAIGTLSMVQDGDGDGTIVRSTVAKGRTFLNEHLAEIGEKKDEFTRKINEVEDRSILIRYAKTQPFPVVCVAILGTALPALCMYHNYVTLLIIQ